MPGHWRGRCGIASNALPSRANAGGACSESAPPRRGAAHASMSLLRSDTISDLQATKGALILSCQGTVLFPFVTEPLHSPPAAAASQRGHPQGGEEGAAAAGHPRCHPRLLACHRWARQDLPTSLYPLAAAPAGPSWYGACCLWVGWIWAGWRNSAFFVTPIFARCMVALCSAREGGYSLVAARVSLSISTGFCSAFQPRSECSAQTAALEPRLLDLFLRADIDATAVHFLDNFLDELKREGLQLALANPSQQVHSPQG